MEPDWCGVRNLSGASTRESKIVMIFCKFCKFWCTSLSQAILAQVKPRWWRNSPGTTVGCPCMSRSTTIRTSRTFTRTWRDGRSIFRFTFSTAVLIRFVKSGTAKERLFRIVRFTKTPTSLPPIFTPAVTSATAITRVTSIFLTQWLILCDPPICWFI